MHNVAGMGVNHSGWVRATVQVDSNRVGREGFAKGEGEIIERVGWRGRLSSITG